MSLYYPRIETSLNWRVRVQEHSIYRRFFRALNIRDGTIVSWHFYAQRQFRRREVHLVTQRSGPLLLQIGTGAESKHMPCSARFMQCD